MSAAVEFNAQMYVSEQLTRQLVNTTQDVAIRCVHVLAEKFNFDADEAIRMLGLNMIKLERKAPVKAKVAKAAKVTAPKSAFPLPYNGEFNDACCYALRQNNGLYTQCTGIRKGEAHFCKGCASQMQKVGAEMPEYGTIQQRMAVGIFECVDPKGRKPIAYSKVMKKYKINEEQVLEEAGKLNMIINPEHFVVPEETKRGRPASKTGEKASKEKGAKGRPKKSKKVLMIEGEDEDLFAALVAEQNELEDENMSTGKKKSVKSEEEKEAERLAKEAEKAEKEAKRLAEKAEKEAKKSKKVEKNEEVKSEPEMVKKIEFEGKKYLKSKKTGLIYDYKKYVNEGEQVVVGKWSETSNKIIFDDAEESEDEYEEEFSM